jgi:tRNA A37 threonylcarbamoyladenosine dehydratase
LNESNLNRFSRTELLIGGEGIQMLGQKQVAVIGLGGVGSFTVEALVRGGIGGIILVDYDEICLTNTNRQLHAVTGNYGRAKVEVMAERAKTINPDLQVKIFQEFITAENLDRILMGGISYVVDAIDTVSSKVAVITYCLQKGIPIVSAMGTGNKFDPLAFKIDDISRTHTCPLAKAVRKALREQGITSGVTVVYSTEKPTEPKTEVPTCRQNCICPNREAQIRNCAGRRQIPGSTSYLPPIAGLMLAGEVIRDLLGIAR